MTVHLVTFASPDMERSMRTCRDSALLNGVERDWLWFSNTIKHLPVYEKHKQLFDAPRGCGFWAWKPVILAHQMVQMFDGDICIYADAGIEFVNNVSHIIDRMDQDIFLFGNQWEHAHWCKADIIEEVWPFGEWPWGDTDDESWARFGKQAQASVIFFRVSDYSRSFVAEWLKWCLHRLRYSTICTDEWRYLIDDSPSIAPNHPEFRENRHDQAILTTMAYREGIKLHWWGARYNTVQPNGGFVYPKSPEYASDDYEPFVHHHRRRNVDWEQAA